MTARLTWLTVGLTGWLLASDAWARAGGGHSFSSGSRSSGGSSFGGSYGGGGGGDVDLGPLLWFLFVEHPWLGLTVAVISVVVVVWQARLAEKHRPWVLDPRRGEPFDILLREVEARRGRPSRAGLDGLRADDPAFSEPVFLDLVQLVVRRAWEARDEAGRAALAAFVAPEVLTALADARPADARVQDVVIASVTPVDVVREGVTDRVDLHVTASLTLAHGHREEARYVEERWSFRRAHGALSLSPEATHRLGCPACASAALCDPMGRCRSCGTPIAAGQLQWQAAAWRRTVERAVERPDLQPFHGGDEPGWTVPTAYDPRLATEGRAFRGRHPDHDDAAFEARLRAVFLAVQAAWDAGRWQDARPFTTDAAWNTLRFWLERHARHGLQNRVADVRVLGMDLVKLGVDPWYEAVTVRVRATCRDWTEELASGRVVGGSDRYERRFSEYWTFLRAVGAKRPVGDAASCPSCGAPLASIEASGACRACGTVVTLGTHDWVLSRIEQPEVYRG